MLGQEFGQTYFGCHCERFFAKQSHHREIATPQGELLQLAMTDIWVLMSDFLSEGQVSPTGDQEGYQSSAGCWVRLTKFDPLMSKM
jgi:hypothetical protein